MAKLTHTLVHANAFLKVTALFDFEKTPKSRDNTIIIKPMKKVKKVISELMIDAARLVKTLVFD
jgi:hypothetical protein